MTKKEIDKMIREQHLSDNEREIRRNPPDWMTIVEASIYMQVSTRTVRSLISSGKLKHSRPTQKILIRRTWIDEYLNACQ